MVGEPLLNPVAEFVTTLATGFPGPSFPTRMQGPYNGW